MANGHRDDLTIDRIDGDGNYCPSNCRWVTQKVNTQNRKETVWIEYGGVSRVAADWSRLLGGCPHLVYRRIHKWGWSVEKAVTTPVRPLGSNLERFRRRGEQIGHAKLTAEKVRELRRSHSAGQKYSELARNANVHVNTVIDVIVGRTWRHVV